MVIALVDDAFFLLDLHGNDAKSHWNCFVKVTMMKTESHETTCFLAQNASLSGNVGSLASATGAVSTLFGARVVHIVSTARG